MKIFDILTSPWAIVSSKLLEIQEIYKTHLKGEKIDLKNLSAMFGIAWEEKDEEGLGYDLIDGVAVIHVEGVIQKNEDFWSRFLGGASTVQIGRSFKTALSDPAVKSILFYFDTPGGTVDGTQELASLIYENRGTKPLIGFSDGIAASGGYWIMSAMDSRYISGDTVEVGSIGVIAKHFDVTEMAKMEGVKVTEIFAGKYKNVGSRFKKLTDEDRNIIQEQVDYLYSIFVGDVARNLGKTEETVLTDMAEGRIFFGRQAIDAGLVDGYSTLDRLIIRYGNETPASIRAMAEEKVMEICQKN